MDANWFGTNQFEVAHLQVHVRHGEQMVRDTASNRNSICGVMSWTCAGYKWNGGDKEESGREGNRLAKLFTLDSEMTQAVRQ